MCTCLAMQGKGLLFGRNMDIEYSFGERVVLRPRGFRQEYKRAERCEKAYAMVGMAALESGVPLYAEACNEKGLCMASLNFPGNAYYFPSGKNGEIELAPYELIPFILERCETVLQAEMLLKKVCVVAVPFREGLPLAPLHWMIADERDCLVAEPMRSGLQIYKNPVRVLTNNPPFPYHRERLNDFLNLKADYPENTMAKELQLAPNSQGMGGIGLPGDASSSSRFVRAAFLLHNSDVTDDSVSQVFHILSGVEMVRGSVRTREGRWDTTTYSCCMDASNGIYYYKVYTNHRIHAVDMSLENLDGGKPLCFHLPKGEDILFQRTSTDQ